LLGALALLAGCGSEARLSKAQYEHRVRSVYENVRQAFQETKVTPAELAPRVKAAQDELRKAAKELEHTRAPQNVEHENDELAEGLRDYADDLDRLRKAAERHDATAVARFNASLASNESVERIAESAEAIVHKGYDLGPIGAG
jgi:predicted nuclease with TOPRIM domain